MGGAWISGAIAGLADATGWDARRASLIVGTSAGAAIGASLRQGLSPVDHSDDPADLPVILPDPPNLSLTGWRPQSPRLVLSSLARITNHRPGLTLAGLAPEGKVPHRLVGDHIRRRMRSPWPEEPIWICGVEMATGRRSVFGRDERPTPDLARAVEASAAIPGYFEPVEIEGERFIDGGAYSVTNADLTRGLGFRLVIVISPMSAVPSAVRPPTLRLGRAFHSRVLAKEVQAVRQTGSHVLVIQPTAADLEVLGPALDAERSQAAGEAGRRTAASKLLTDDHAAAMLSG